MADQQEEFGLLMERVRAHSDGAIRELIDRYGEHILRVIRRRLNRRLRAKYDSNDFMQAVWASFFALPPEKYHFERPEDLVTFFAALAHNKVVDVVRDRLLRPTHNVNRERSMDEAVDSPEEDLVSREPLPQEIAIAREEWQRLLEGQPSRYQQILKLLREGRSREEIAAELRIHEKTVERVLRKLEQERAHETS
jgi:RNA polymerase sigma factor (sigma-70 family)